MVKKLICQIKLDFNSYIIQLEIETKDKNKAIIRNNREKLQEQLEKVGRNILYGNEENNFKIPLPKYLIDYS